MCMYWQLHLLVNTITASYVNNKFHIHRWSQLWKTNNVPDDTNLFGSCNSHVWFQLCVKVSIIITCIWMSYIDIKSTNISFAVDEWSPSIGMQGHSVCRGCRMCIISTMVIRPTATDVITEMVGVIHVFSSAGGRHMNDSFSIPSRMYKLMMLFRMFLSIFWAWVNVAWWSAVECVM